MNKMSIIIRLQNLPLEANSLDIRRFFHGLQIPDGGVHIVGGDNGDAFIAFASDEDARQAMERNGHTIKDCRIKLLLSSRNEMQKIIDLARNQTIAIKPLDNNSNQTNYVNSGHMALPNVQQNSIKSNLSAGRLTNRSPDRRGINSRSMDRENRLRDRSRSPLRNERDVNLNGNAGNGLNRMGSMSSGLMNTIRDSLNNTYPSLDTPVRSRLGYSDAMPSSLIHEERGGQWQPNDNYGVQRMNSSGDFDRNADLMRDNHLIRNQSDRSYTIELRNLPFNIVVRDIINFFNGLFVPEENIKILIDDRGLTTGGALVRFNNERDFDAALSMNKRFLSDRKIDVQPLIDSVIADNNDALYPQQSLAPSIAPNMGQRQASGHDLVLYMKGLPYNNCTEVDVTKFFEPIKLVDIVIECDPKGKISGNAFVEFETIGDYELALQRNMKHMGRRYIELLPTTRDDMLDARRLFQTPNGQNASDMSKTFCINITGLPPSVANRDLTNYFSSHGAQPYAIHIMLRPDGFNAGEAYVEFGSHESQYIALKRDGDFIDNCRIMIKSVSFEAMRQVVGNPNPPPVHMPDSSMASLPHSRPPRGTRFDDHMRPPRRGDREDRRSGRNDPFSDIRCVIVSTNIPYKASIEDICVFFSDFSITEECVRRRFNEKGQPTADAQIAFHSPEDATRALRQMHKKFLIGRPVFLRHA
ncbi:RNA-binding protein 12-like [Oppia nitens]|uniref:RNA-binding protein 12-like n=1 Tax=Oppia nitens TaxID=1686743 RepID=UPI0023DB4097|nr:RNA-binding protein 12-like [Oppia nitens]XP_054165376.1 RNA-binding protein 12-like [Oppia nitens]